jgi:hypothetical protein
VRYRNLTRAYDALWAEHQRIHRIHVRILARGNVKLERRLMRGRLEDEKYIDKLLDYEEELTRSKQRSVLRLNRYGIKIENLMEALLKLDTDRIRAEL